MYAVIFYINTDNDFYYNDLGHRVEDCTENCILFLADSQQEAQKAILEHLKNFINTIGGGGANRADDLEQIKSDLLEIYNTASNSIFWHCITYDHGNYSIFYELHELKQL